MAGTAPKNWRMLTTHCDVFVAKIKKSTRRKKCGTLELWRGPIDSTLADTRNVFAAVPIAGEGKSGMSSNPQSLNSTPGRLRLQLTLPELANAPMDEDQRRAVAAILRHDHESSSAELVYYFVHELGVAERTAWEAVAERARF